MKINAVQAQIGVEIVRMITDKMKTEKVPKGEWDEFLAHAIYRTLEIGDLIGIERQEPPPSFRGRLMQIMIDNGVQPVKREFTEEGEP